MRRALAVAVLVTLAGCGAAPTDTGTLTPAPLPRDADAGPAAEATPGFGRPGAADPFALASAHGFALANRSYTVTSTLVVRDENGTLRSVTRTAYVAPGGVPYRSVRTARSAPGHPVTSLTERLEVWYDGRTTAYRVRRGDGGNRSGRGPGLGDPLGDLDGEQRLASLYAGFRSWNAQCGPDGCHLVGARPAGTGPLDLPVLVTDPSNASLRLQVTPEGRVEWSRLRYDARFDGRPVTVVRRMRFRAVGRTVVLRPVWVAAANVTGPAPGDRSKVPL